MGEKPRHFTKILIRHDLEDRKILAEIHEDADFDTGDVLRCSRARRLQRERDFAQAARYHMRA